MNEREANKYIIYQAIMETLPQCRNIEDLKEKLVKKKIETLYKYKGQTNELQGISFKIGDYIYKGSEIDRKFSINNLGKTLNQQRIKNILLPKLFSAKSNWHFKEEDNETGKPHELHKNIVNLLLKPEKGHPMQIPLLEKKPKKRKSRGLHL